MIHAIRRPIAAVTSLFDRSFDPARARQLPIRNEASESNVRGLYLIGEIAGTPLIKLSLNRGRAVIDHIAGVDLKIKAGDREEGGWDPSDPRTGEWHDVVIIGAGSAGLGAADRCQQLGLAYLVIEQERPAQLIRNFTKGKPLYKDQPADAILIDPGKPGVHVAVRPHKALIKAPAPPRSPPVRPPRRPCQYAGRSRPARPPFSETSRAPDAIRADD